MGLIPVPGQTGQQGILTTGTGQVDVMPADSLPVGSLLHLSPKGSCEQLASKADAQDRKVGFMGGFQQVELTFDPWLALVIRCHWTTHGDHTVDIFQIVRELITMMEIEVLETMSMISKHGAQSAASCKIGMFQNENRHGKVSFVWRRSGRPWDWCLA